MTDENDILIIAISFLEEDLIQIQYAEMRDRSQAAAVQRSIMIDAQYLVEGELETLLEAARELVDKGLILIRNPPEIKAPRSRGGDGEEVEASGTGSE